MKLITPISWFAAAAGVLFVGIAAHEAAFGVAAVFAGGIGVGTLFPALKDRWSAQSHLEPANPTDHRLEQLEQRLRQTEDELATATKHLDRLKDERDFDLQLRLQKTEAERTR